MENKISYLNRTFSDYKEALKEYSKKYYPDMESNFDDASIGSWLIDINAEIGDNLSYYIDKAIQETSIDSANEKSSIYNIARNLGYKIPGAKGAMAEVAFTCDLPLSTENSEYPDYAYAPIIKRGTRVGGGNQSFELLEDIDFSEQFNKEGTSDRTIVPIKNNNGQLYKYRITKLGVVVAGETKIYRKTITNSDITPFMEVLIPVENVMNVESVLVKDGTDIQRNPTYGEFYRNNEKCSDSETDEYTRFFEVESLAQQKIWGEVGNGLPVKVEYTYNDAEVPTYSITRGEWKHVRHKFITEFTDKGYMKVIFGSGVEDDDMSAYGNTFAKYQISKVMRNNSLGYLPKPNSTLFILYRCGGGKTSNLAKGAINSILTLNIENRKSDDTASAVRTSIKVVNTTPSVSGKDMPTEKELKYLIKYNSGAQRRCVTTKDYIERILSIPPKYGTPFRVGVMEANNKIMVYLLGINNKGKLDNLLPEALVSNLQTYLSEYRMINDFVEIKSGKIINISFDVEMFIDKNYNKSDVVSTVITKIKGYMDINAHNMGDDIFIGDLEKVITQIDGVISIISLRVYNNIGGEYSDTHTNQSVISDAMSDGTMEEIDLEASDGILYSDGDTMLEIKYPEKDIRIKIKER